jgi:hypothetical protein
MTVISEAQIQKEELKNPKNNNLDYSISLWIDSYDDIFSDFDPRPFSARNISDDFLYEVKKVSGENDFLIKEFKLLIPNNERNFETELVITKRLHNYFTKNQYYFLGKKTTEIKKGFLFTLFGVLMMVGASLVSSLNTDKILWHTLLVIIEPAGWFLVWSGMETLINTSRKEKPELDFYNKISKSKIVFLNIK